MLLVDWGRKQSDEPTCRAATVYLQMNCLIPFPDEPLQQVPSHAEPTAQEFVGLATKGELCISNDGIALLVRRKTLAPLVHKPIEIYARLLGDEPTRICAELLMIPWVMRGCHSETSHHFGAVSVLHRFYCRLPVTNAVFGGFAAVFCVNRTKVLSKTARWPTILLPLPSGPGNATSV